MNNNSMIYETFFNLKKARRDNALSKKSYDSLLSRIETLRVENNKIQKGFQTGNEKQRTKADISKLCRDLFNDFSEAKKDYDSGQLNISKYQAILNVLKYLIDACPNLDGDAIHEWEVLAECHKQKVIG